MNWIRHKAIVLCGGVAAADHVFYSDDDNASRLAQKTKTGQGGARGGGVRDQTKSDRFVLGVVAAAAAHHVFTLTMTTRLASLLFRSSVSVAYQNTALSPHQETSTKIGRSALTCWRPPRPPPLPLPLRPSCPRRPPPRQPRRAALRPLAGVSRPDAVSTSTSMAQYWKEKRVGKTGETNEKLTVFHGCENHSVRARNAQLL